MTIRESAPLQVKVQVKRNKYMNVIKGTIHPEMKIQSLSSHSDAVGKSSEVA